jgi:hypothetical protein
VSNLISDCISDSALTLDEFIFDYFNNLNPDVVRELVEKWNEIRIQERDANKKKAPNER